MVDEVVVGAGGGGGVEAFGTGAPADGGGSPDAGRRGRFAASVGRVWGVAVGARDGVADGTGAATDGAIGGAEIGVADAAQGWGVAGSVVSAPPSPAAERKATVIFLRASRAGSGMRLGGPRC